MSFDHNITLFLSSIRHIGFLATDNKIKMYDSLGTVEKGYRSFLQLLIIMIHYGSGWVVTV